MTSAPPHTTVVGDIRITSILDGGRSMRAERVWTGAAAMSGLFERSSREPERWKGFTEDDWAAHPDALTADGRLRMDIGGYLITGCDDRVTMVDVGNGPGESFFINGGDLLNNLRRAGCDPSDVTDVVFTHLHEDHIGWTYRDGTSHFPNATLHCHRADWEHFSRADPGSGGGESANAAMAILAPVREQLELWQDDFVLASGCTIVAAPGHTPGSAIVSLRSKDSRAILLGDAVHCVAELLDPNWAGLGDLDPDQASLARQRIVAELVDESTLIGAAHFAGLRLGRIDRCGEQPRFNRV